MTAGNKPTNHVDPQIMTEKDRGRFCMALRGAGTFIRILRDHYQLDLTSR